MSASLYSQQTQFQFTLPRGERPKGAIADSVMQGFQFTLPRGERQVSPLSLASSSEFQFTLPRGERRETTDGTQMSIGFNSRSREGSDFGVFLLLCWYRVSIHAPARGATSLCSPLLSSIDVSIHAPARGATYARRHDRPPHPCFNSRSREGSDRNVSRTMCLLCRFNSRSREGSD